MPLTWNTRDASNGPPVAVVGGAGTALAEEKEETNQEEVCTVSLCLHL